MRSEVQLLLDPPHPCRGCGERTAEDVQGHPSLSGRGIGTCGCPVTRLRQLTSLREQNTRRLEVVPEWGRDRVGGLRVRGSQDSLSKSEDTDREGGSGAHAPFLPLPCRILLPGMRHGSCSTSDRRPKDGLGNEPALKQREARQRRQISPRKRARLLLDRIKRDKGVWWMPWQQEAMKDAIPCDKLWGAGNRL